MYVQRYGIVGTALILLQTTSHCSQLPPVDEHVKSVIPPRPAPVPNRTIQMMNLKSHSDRAKPIDLIVIGGGATGASTALDAVTRGIHTCLIERSDFASSTSSKSTKMIHGGVRYLEKAVKSFDRGQYKLVQEALHERKAFMNNAPYLTRPFAIMTPCYKYWQVPYFWAGLKMYDLVAWSQGLTMSRYMSPSESYRVFPTLAPMDHEGRSLKGTIVYYDGQFNDARMCVMLAVTAAHAGAIVANYTEVKNVIVENGKAVGVMVRDQLSHEEFPIYGNVVVNATGPYADELRKDVKPVLQGSSGVHVTLPEYYSPDDMGLIVPKTKDGRVVFMLPWLDHTIAGTTDTKCKPGEFPKAASDEDIKFILDSIDPYLTITARRSDVTSAWVGVRPLVVDADAKDTQNIVREHLLKEEVNGVITITGGKWTTYRKMAEETVDSVGKKLLTSGKLLRGCVTKHYPILGSHGWSPAMFTTVAQNYTVPHRPGAIDTRVAKHLSNSYGTGAFEITRIAEARNLGHRLAKGHPMIEAEVIYCVQREFCLKAQDFLAFRTRLAFLDVRAAIDAMPRVIELMSQELNWSKQETEQARKECSEFLKNYKFG